MPNEQDRTIQARGVSEVEPGSAFGDVLGDDVRDDERSGQRDDETREGGPSGHGARLRRGSPGRSGKIRTRYTVAFVRLITPCSSSAACAAASRAIGMRNGEHDT